MRVVQSTGLAFRFYYTGLWQLRYTVYDNARKSLATYYIAEIFLLFIPINRHFSRRFVVNRIEWMRFHWFNQQHIVLSFSNASVYQPVCDGDKCVRVCVCLLGQQQQQLCAVVIFIVICIGLGILIAIRSFAPYAWAQYESIFMRAATAHLVKHPFSAVVMVRWHFELKSIIFPQ